MTDYHLNAGLKQVALDRIKEAQETMRYHENLALSERGKIVTLIRTWKLCPKASGVETCCLDPENCNG